MPAGRHTDAIGYLNDLAAELNQPWFTMVSHLASSDIEQIPLDELQNLFMSQGSYNGSPVETASPPSPIETTSGEHLQTLSEFKNFKRLHDTLTVDLQKRLTVIFGTNGSGKSSLCEALRILANPEQPKRPIHNAHAQNTQPPSFCYRFSSDSSPRTWTDSDGYGRKEDVVKYFDTNIAYKYLKKSVEPGRVIELTPFRLNVFDNATEITQVLKDCIGKKILEVDQLLIIELASMRRNFVAFPGCLLASATEITSQQLLAEIDKGRIFVASGQCDTLNEMRSLLSELERAATEEGMRLLKAEMGELKALAGLLGNIADNIEILWGSDTTSLVHELSEKQAARKLLVKSIAEDGNVDGLLSLLKSASALTPLNEIGSDPCPLCRQPLGEPERELFAKYHVLLSNKLETEIAELEAGVKRGSDIELFLKKTLSSGLEAFRALPEATTNTTRNYLLQIEPYCTVNARPDDSALATFKTIRRIVTLCTEAAEKKASAISTSEAGVIEMKCRIAALKSRIAELGYAELIIANIDSLEQIYQILNERDTLTGRIPSFAQVLKKITDKAKLAYDNLVVTDFEARLNAEYLALAEKRMDSFGVQLVKKGADGAVTVRPRVGKHDIDGVLSEGEQRLHALALFFAELESSCHSIVVFDDPVSSFDYNYIENYCIRIRDFMLSNPTRQVVILTHNWEFFIHLQRTVCSCHGLAGQSSVQVLECCATVDEYDEDINRLKNDIQRTLAADGEFGRLEKDSLASKMRRLIESIINYRVFNGLRYQFKQKNQRVSEFHKYTAIVPLAQSEAVTLNDLFRKLSPSEHDDPRTFYISTDKAMFQTRYNQMCAIEADIVSRGRQCSSPPS